MADAPKPAHTEKPHKRFSLLGLFNRKAGRVMPPIPEEILKDKRVRKEIFRRRNRKIFRALSVAFALSATTSLVTINHPDLVSTPFNQYMADHGYAGDLQSHYYAPDIRVYERSNILYPFHMAGNETRIVWHENLKKSAAPQNIAALALETPVLYAKGLTSGFAQMLFPNMLDAYSMANDDAPNTRSCFIRPPADFSVAEFFKNFSNVNTASFHFKNSQDALKKTLFEYVMLHEARHCDQPKTVFTTANEADADLYAFRVLEARGTNPALLQETVEIIAHLRTINAVMHGDTDHVSTFTLARGAESILTAHQDAASFGLLRDVLDETLKNNTHAFQGRMSEGLRAYYAAAALDRSNLLKSDPQLARANGAFLSAINYFDAMSGGKLVNAQFDINRIDLSYLAGRYVPVKDKLAVPPADRAAMQAHKPPRPSV